MSHGTCLCSFFQDPRVCLRFPSACGLGTSVASAFPFFFHVSLTALLFSRIHFFCSSNPVTLVADLTSHVLGVSMTHGSDEKSLFSLIWPFQGGGGGEVGVCARARARGEGMGEILIFLNLLAGSIVSATTIWCST